MDNDDEIPYPSPMTLDYLRTWVAVKWDQTEKIHVLLEEAIKRRILNDTILQELSGNHASWLEHLSLLEKELALMKQQPLSYLERVELESLIAQASCTRAFDTEIIAVVELMQTEEGKAYREKCAALAVELPNDSQTLRGAGALRTKRSPKWTRKQSKAW